MRVIILLALLGAAFAVPKNASRIVGGSTTTIETYPYMSNMQWSSSPVGFWSQACGGSLITSTAVLSAAHCFYGDPQWQWRVVLGTTLAQSGGRVHTIASIVIHPQYIHSIVNNDVAVVRLTTPAVFSSTVQTASIASANYNVPDGATVTYVGWGALRYNGPGSEQLRHVHVNVINQQLCAQRYAYLKTQPGYQNWPDINQGMMCSGILNQGGRDACQGDSGGPLAQSGNIVIGVTSWGFECADSFYPGVSARVSQYSNWIVANHQGQSSEQLLHVHVNIINQQLCAQRYIYLKSQPGFQHWPDINEGMVCAGILDQGGRDACQGDSGGPLTHFGSIIVGITSWGYRCADSFFPGVSARVSHYSNWIVANVNS